MEPFENFHRMGNAPRLKPGAWVMGLVIPQRPVPCRRQFFLGNPGRNNFGNDRIALLAAQDLYNFVTRQFRH